MDADAARQLVNLAKQKGLHLACAPCSLLSETAQTMWKAVKDGAVGKIRLVYANFDDGLIAPKMFPWTWLNRCGVPWPAKDEFEMGCTSEHAAYVLTWLAAFFGPALSVTGFASCQIPDKGIPVVTMAPDFSVGCIQYSDGVVARVTCGIVAPRDKSIIIIGDDGIISTRDIRNDAAPVYVQQIPSTGMKARMERRLNSLRRGLECILPSIPWSGNDWHFRRKYPFARKPAGIVAGESKRVDFCRGLAELAAAVREQRPCRLSADLACHILEMIEALQYPERFGGYRKLESTFDAIPPLPWKGWNNQPSSRKVYPASFGRSNRS
jgi:predicted dehydrogenase